MMSNSTDSNGSFDKESVQQADPMNPLAFTNMIMHRTKIAHQSGHGSPDGIIVQTIWQIMLYNMTKNARYM